jgi:hypothetical protein
MKASKPLKFGKAPALAAATKSSKQAKPRKKAGPRPGKGPGGFTVMYGS